MLSYKNKHSIFFRFIIIAVICCFILSDAVFALHLRDSASNSALSPISRFNPVVRLKWQGDGYSIIENEEERGKFTKGFQEDAAFVYLNLLIGQFLKDLSDLSMLGVSSNGLDDEFVEIKNGRLDKFIRSIEQNLPHIDFSRFRFEEMTWEDDRVCLPYERKDDGRIQILKYFMPDGKPVEFPHRIYMPTGIDDVKVILEDPFANTKRPSAGARNTGNMKKALSYLGSIYDNLLHRTEEEGFYWDESKLANDMIQFLSDTESFSGFAEGLVARISRMPNVRFDALEQLYLLGVALFKSGRQEKGLEYIEKAKRLVEEADEGWEKTRLLLDMAEKMGKVEGLTSRAKEILAEALRDTHKINAEDHNPGYHKAILFSRLARLLYEAPAIVNGIRGKGFWLVPFTGQTLPDIPKLTRTLFNRAIEIGQSLDDTYKEFSFREIAHDMTRISEFAVEGFRLYDKKIKNRYLRPEYTSKYGYRCYELGLFDVKQVRKIFHDGIQDALKYNQRRRSIERFEDERPDGHIQDVLHYMMKVPELLDEAIKIAKKRLTEKPRKKKDKYWSLYRDYAMRDAAVNTARHTGDFDRAIKIAEKEIVNFEQDDAYVGIIELLLEKSKVRKAEALLRRIVDHEKRALAEWHFFKFWVSRMDEQFLKPEFMAALRSELSDDPFNSSIHDVFIAAGRFLPENVAEKTGPDTIEKSLMDLGRVTEGKIREGNFNYLQLRYEKLAGKKSGRKIILTQCILLRHIALHAVRGSYEAAEYLHDEVLKICGRLDQTGRLNVRDRHIILTLLNTGKYRELIPLLLRKLPEDIKGKISDKLIRDEILHPAEISLLTGRADMVAEFPYEKALQRKSIHKIISLDGFGGMKDVEAFVDILLRLDKWMFYESPYTEEDYSFRDDYSQHGWDIGKIEAYKWLNKKGIKPAFLHAASLFSRREDYFRDQGFEALKGFFKKQGIVKNLPGPAVLKRKVLDILIDRCKEEYGDKQTLRLIRLAEEYTLTDKIHILTTAISLKSALTKKRFYIFENLFFMLKASLECAEDMPQFDEYIDAFIAHPVGPNPFIEEEVIGVERQLPSGLDGTADRQGGYFTWYSAVHQLVKTPERFKILLEFIRDTLRGNMAGVAFGSNIRITTSDFLQMVRIAEKFSGNKKAFKSCFLWNSGFNDSLLYGQLSKSKKGKGSRSPLLQYALQAVERTSKNHFELIRSLEALGHFSLFSGGRMNKRQKEIFYRDIIGSAVLVAKNGKQFKEYLKFIAGIRARYFTARNDEIDKECFRFGKEVPGIAKSARDFEDFKMRINERLDEKYETSAERTERERERAQREWQAFWAGVTGGGGASWEDIFGSFFGFSGGFRGDGEGASGLSIDRDYYRILGVARDASEKEIDKAYRDVALRFHPDMLMNMPKEKLLERIKKVQEWQVFKGKDLENLKEIQLWFEIEDEDKRKRAVEAGISVFKLAAEAHEVLGDTDKKMRYDRMYPGAGNEKDSAAAIGKGEVEAGDVAQRVRVSKKVGIDEVVPGYNDMIESFFMDGQKIPKLISTLIIGGMEYPLLLQVLTKTIGISFGDGFTVREEGFVTRGGKGYHVVKNQGVVKDKDNYVFGTVIDGKSIIFIDLIRKLLASLNDSRFEREDIERALIALWIHERVEQEPEYDHALAERFQEAIDEKGILYILMDELAEEYTNEDDSASGYHDDLLKDKEPGFMFPAVFGALRDSICPTLDKLSVKPDGAVILGEDWFYESMEGWLRPGARHVREGTTPDAFNSAFLENLADEKLVMSANVFSLFEDFSGPLQELHKRLSEGGYAVFIQNIVPHPCSVMKELVGEKGFVYSPEMDAFFPDRAKMQTVLTVLRRGLQYGIGSDAFNEYSLLRERYSINVSQFYHDKLLNNLKATGFTIVKEGHTHSHYIGERQKRHRRIKSDQGWVDVPDEVNYIKCKDGMVSLQRVMALSPGKVFEYANVRIVVARKDAKDVDDISVPSDDIGDRQIEVLSGEIPCELLKNESFEKLPDETKRKIRKVLTTSFSKLVMGVDYDMQVGRSAIIHLPRDENGEIRPVIINGKTIRAVKVKGVTFDKDDDIATYMNNPEIMYYFDAIGRLMEIPVPATPLGCQNRGRMENEYALYGKALKGDVNADLPLGGALFKGRYYENEETAATLLGLEDENNHIRFIDNLAGLLGCSVEFKPPWDHIISTNFKDDMIESNRGRIITMFRGIGEELRRLHGSGIIYIFPYMAQMSYVNGRVNIHDLEDSLFQDGMTIDQKIAYRIQDLRTMLFTMMSQTRDQYMIIRKLESMGIDARRLILEAYFADILGDNPGFSEIIDMILSNVEAGKDTYDFMNDFFSRTLRNQSEVILAMQELIYDEEAAIKAEEERHADAGGVAQNSPSGENGPDLERERNIAVDFRDTIIRRANEAKAEGQFIILGLDESWIPDMSGPQAVISELERLPENLKQLGLDNVLFIRGRGDEVARKIHRRREDTRTNFSNIIILGDRSIVGNDEFTRFKGSTSEDSALLIGIDPKHLSFTSGIRILEMYLLAIRLNSGKAHSELDTTFIKISVDPKGRVRSFIFTPIEPYDVEQFRKVNDIQIREIDRKA